MRLFRSADRVAACCRRIRRAGGTIGLVPTMGALHEGHLSLVRAAAQRNDVAVVSIFVNPLQFGPREDFARYPRNLPRDLRLLKRAGAHVVFSPSARQLYSNGFETSVDVGELTRRWEGELRPGHFRGVATVVMILFQLVQPTDAYFGQKDYQQVLVVRRLIRDLRLPMRLRMVPIIREADGLAMSSRNAYLTRAQRRAAGSLHRALQTALGQIRRGERNASRLSSMMRRTMESAGLLVEYAALVDAESLEPLRRLRGRVAALVAARAGRTCLIDNVLVEVS